MSKTIASERLITLNGQSRFKIDERPHVNEVSLTMAIKNDTRTELEQLEDSLYMLVYQNRAAAIVLLDILDAASADEELINSIKLKEPIDNVAQIIHNMKYAVADDLLYS